MSQNRLFSISVGLAIAPALSKRRLQRAGIVVIVFASIILTAQAQSFSVLYNFTGGRDGAEPAGQLVMDSAGSLYIGTSTGGSDGFGTVIKLKHTSGGWVLQPLYDFAGTDGGSIAYITLAPNGSVYGASSGGGSGNCGTVFNLRPSPTPPTTSLSPWELTVLHWFGGGVDGCGPAGAPIFDHMGNLYGATVFGGPQGGDGTVYELVRSGSSYTEEILYSFGAGGNGALPSAGLAFDSVGSLYGVTAGGGQYGNVFKLTNSGSGWTESVLYDFTNGNDGGDPATALILDGSGNLYGTTETGGVGGGTVFKLTAGSWTYSVLVSLTGAGGPQGGELTMDASGNIYGTTYGDGAHNLGSVFSLTPSDGSYTYTDLHDFTGGSDGRNPLGGVTLDSNGNLYGTASGGGTHGDGVIWEVTR
jgi:uncharacterized repeat protein (TIGR03803 family)